jgi:hypothetical protein
MLSHSKEKRHSVLYNHGLGLPMTRPCHWSHMGVLFLSVLSTKLMPGRLISKMVGYCPWSNKYLFPFTLLIFKIYFILFSLCVCMCVCLSASLSLYVCVCAYVCVYVCVSLCAYVCVCVFILLWIILELFSKYYTNLQCSELVLGIYYTSISNAMHPSLGKVCRCFPIWDSEE